MVRVRFAPSPTGSLHLGNALTAVANRRFADAQGGTFVLRIDDTDPSRTVEGGEAALLDDLGWLGVRFDEGPVRQSERGALYSEAAGRALASGAAVRRFRWCRASDEGRHDASPCGRNGDRISSLRSPTIWISGSPMSSAATTTGQISRYSRGSLARSEARSPR